MQLLKKLTSEGHQTLQVLEGSATYPPYTQPVKLADVCFGDSAGTSSACKTVFIMQLLQKLTMEGYHTLEISEED